MENGTHVSASEFQKSFGAISDAALKDPVFITKQGREHLVIMAADEYKRLRRHAQLVHKTSELPEAWRDAVLSAKMDSRHNHLNRLLDV